MVRTAKYFVVALCVSVLFVIGFNQSVLAQTKSSGQPQKGGSFIWNHNGGIPQIGAPADNLGAFVANRNSYPALETLLKTDDNERIQPGLAESWSVAKDGKSITFQLRKGIKFHDGTDFNAEAVKYNLEAVAKANIRGSNILVEKVASYEVVDPLTLRMNLKEWDSTLLLRLAQSVPGLGLIASPTAMKKEATPETMAKLHCVGTGPFMFDSWKRDSFVKYKKWDGYWQKGKPYLDEIKIQSIADLTTSIMSLKSGESQAVENVDPVDAKQLEKEGFDIWQPNLYFLHSILPDGNNPNSPFAKKNVRLALEYAIDKRAIAKGVGMGYYEALNQMAWSKAPWFNASLPYREYDPKKAKQLLAEAGYPNGFKTKLVTDVMARKDTLVAVQTYLKEVGIETELQVLEFGAAFVKSKQGWEGIYFPGFPNVGTLVGIVERWGTANDYVSLYRPAGWQEKWNALRAQRDEKKLMGQLKELVKILYDEVIAVPYQGDAPLLARSRNLHGFDLHSNHMVSFYEPQNIWLGKEK